MRDSNIFRYAKDMWLIPETYAMNLKDTLLAPAIDACVFQYLGHDVPWPTVKSIKAFALLFGHNAGAVRTALSRARQRQDLIQNNERAQPGAVIRDYVSYFLKDRLDTRSFSLIVAQFSREENAQRHLLKDRLARLGYVRFAPNTFLRYGGDPTPVNTFLAQQNLQHSVYHFENIERLPPNLEARLPELYQLKDWSERLANYRQFLTAYLGREPITSEQGYLRYLYIRSAFHKRVMVLAPLLPKRYFAEVELLRDMYQELGDLAHEHQVIFVSHYQTFFG